MKPKRAVLSEAAFGDLVRGKSIIIETWKGEQIEIALADIGWDRMYFQLERAMRDAGIDEL